jgi:ArsR family transcriptional regulator
MPHEFVPTVFCGILPCDTLKKREFMERLASYFKALADENRLRILSLLFHGELCGCDIQYVLGASQSTVSRHLSYLKNAGLVLDRRVGYRVFYRLVQSEDHEISELFAYLIPVFAKDQALKADTKKLREAIKDGACTLSEWKPLSAVPSLKHLREGA